MPPAPTATSVPALRGAHLRPLKQYFPPDHVLHFTTARTVSRAKMIFEGRITPFLGTRVPGDRGLAFSDPLKDLIRRPVIERRWGSSNAVKFEFN